MIFDVLVSFHANEDRGPLALHPPSLNEVLSAIDLNDINSEKDILAEQVALRLS